MAKRSVRAQNREGSYGRAGPSDSAKEISGVKKPWLVSPEPRKKYAPCGGRQCRQRKGNDNITYGSLRLDILEGWLLTCGGQVSVRDGGGPNPKIWRASLDSVRTGRSWQEIRLVSIARG